MFSIELVQADYKISNYQQNIQIQSDGNALVTKEITYSFDDNMNGIYLKEGLNAPANSQQNYTWGGLQSITVSRNGEKPQLISPRSGNESIGYVESLSPNQVEEKVYYPIKKHNNIQVTYRYQINNVVTNWDDVSEINWLMITNWDVALNHVNITLTLPQKPDRVLKAWVHNRDIYSGHVRVDQKNAKLIVTTNKISKNERLELRTYFSNSQTPLNQNKQPGKRAQIISNQEGAIVVKNNAKLKRIAIIGLIVLPLVILVIAIFSIIMTLRTRQQLKFARQRSGVDKSIVHIYDIPNDLGPAIVNSRIRGKATHANLIVATLMDLIARHKVVLSYTDVVKVDQVTYQVKDETGLMNFEKQLIHMIFGKNRRIVTQKEFKQTDSALAKGIRLGLPLFLKQIKQNPLSSELIDEQKTNQLTNRKKMLITILSFMIIGTLVADIVMANYSDIWQFWLVAIGEIVVSGLSYYVILKQSSIFYTIPTGFEEKWTWDGFKLMLHDIAKLDKKNVLDSQLWDKLLAYAVIFGEAKQVAKTLKLLADEAHLPMVNLPLLLIYTQFGNQWANELVQHVQADIGFQSNVSGNGGNFSGGGFSGGGGGGGGAF